MENEELWQRVKRGLCALGNSADEIADNLTARGILGGTDLGNPIEHFVRSFTPPGTVVSVDRCGIVLGKIVLPFIRQPPPPTPESYGLPAHIADFVDGYDERRLQPQVATTPIPVCVPAYVEPEDDEDLDDETDSELEDESFDDDWDDEDDDWDDDESDSELEDWLDDDSEDDDWDDDESDSELDDEDDDFDDDDSDLE